MAACLILANNIAFYGNNNLAYGSLVNNLKPFLLISLNRPSTRLFPVQIGISATQLYHHLQIVYPQADTDN